MILEHLSSKDGVDFVKSAAPQVGGTITPYHMVLTRTDWLGWGLKPYMYCMPVIKTAKDRAALRTKSTPSLEERCSRIMRRPGNCLTHFDR